MQGQCKCCSQQSDGVVFFDWVKPTFTDFDKLMAGEIICNACLFFFEESSVELAVLMGKEKPQRMRNYSHFIVGGEWIPLSKGSKNKMRELLLDDIFPELAAIADSGQKHIVFRATRNAAGSKAGWVQFEEQRIYLVPDELRALIILIDGLYAGFSKSEIETGNYIGWRILQFGLNRWQDLESQIKPIRGKPLFYLALFLAQRSNDGESGNVSNTIATESDGSAVDGDLARDACGFQKPVSDDHLDTVREPGEERGIHQQSSKVYQPTLFET